jgi:ABC-type Zn uptake system ZnuABC Zn-binding protein ZnuA
MRNKKEVSANYAQDLENQIKERNMNSYISETKMTNREHGLNKRDLDAAYV